MMGDNGVPETPDWTAPPPKCCPFANCGVCETQQQAFWRHGPQALADQAIPAEGVE